MPSGRRPVAYHLRVIRGKNQLIIPPSFSERVLEALALFVSPAGARVRVASNSVDIDTVQRTIDGRRSGRSKSPLVIVELLTDNPSTRDVAYIAAQIQVSLSRHPGWPKQLLFVLERPDLLNAELFGALAETAAEIVVVIRRTSGVLYALENRSFISRPVPASEDWSRAVVPSVKGAEPEAAVGPADLDILFDHFLVTVNGTRCHSNVVPRLRRLSADGLHLEKVRHVCESVMGNRSFAIASTGSFASEIGRIALTIVEGDTSRVVEGAQAPKRRGSQLLVLVDTLSDHRGIEAAVDAFQGRGWSVHLGALCATAGRPAVDVPEVVLCELPAIAASYLEQDCPYCLQGVPVTPSDAGEGEVSPRDYERTPGELEPKVFWDLMRWSDEFTSFGHWRSPYTDNHFSLRIVVAPLFSLFATAIAFRIRARLASCGILPEWVHGIVCTDGAESAELAEAVRELFRLPKEAVLRVPGEYRQESAESGLGPNLSQWLDLTDNQAAQYVAGRNVLILDQAAHHFRTYSALRRVANHLGCTRLAFSVVISRSANQEEIEAVMNDVHFLPLYSWANPSWLRFSCPCGISGRQ